MWNIHANKIKEVTGITNKEDYKNNPDAQEKYQNYLGKLYKDSISNIKDKYKLNVQDETLMMLLHFLGEKDANIYIKTLNDTKNSTGTADYEAAQKAVNDSIYARTGNIPKNVPIKDYIIKFNNKLSQL